MKTLITILVAAFIQGATAADLRLFNPDALGKSMDEAILLLVQGNTNAMAPVAIHLDIAATRIWGARLTYPKSVKLEEVREALNSLYKKHERPKLTQKDKMGAWRNEEQGFSIMAAFDEDEKAVIVTYIALGRIPGDVLGNALGQGFKKMQEKEMDSKKSK